MMLLSLPALLYLDQAHVVGSVDAIVLLLLMLLLLAPIFSSQQTMKLNLA